MPDEYAAPAPDGPAAAPEPRAAKYWHDQLIEYRRCVEDKWSTQRDNLDKLYARERSDSADREYSIFWANIEVLKEATYARPPAPVVVPRFKDSNVLARAATEMLERCLVTTFEQSDIDQCMREVRDEFLRYGRGTARVRLGNERVVFDHFGAADFAHDPNARNWAECKWIGFRAWLTLDELTKRFGELLLAQGLSVSAIPRKKREDKEGTNEKSDQAPVWEIWCRETGLVHFVNEEFATELDTQQPWLDLSSFWPCPRPAFGTLKPKTLRPVPDIVQYKDQIEEINEYTARIAALSEALRVKGFYPAGAGELSDAIETALKSVDNRATLVPVSSAAALGGTSFKDAVIWMPVVEILETIKGLVELRRVLIDDVYQITGISDIMRGDTEADETLGAQQLKSQWGSVRIRGRQTELARFARDLTRIAGEIIAENFQPQTLREMSQVQLPDMMQKQQLQQQAQMAQQAAQMGQQVPPPPPEMKKMLQQPAFEEVVQFLRNDKARGFVIEIETDSTIQPDEDAEKQRRMEFVTAIGMLMKEAGPMVAQAPPLGPFIGEVIRFVAQGFRAGRPLMGAIDQLSDQLNQLAQMPMGPKSDPVQEAKLKGVEAKAQADQQQAQAKMQQTEMDMQRSTLEHQQEMEAIQMRAMYPQPVRPQQVQ